jgi:hypothetical protein
VAYQIDRKTVFRAGGGIFYERIATFGVGITSNYTRNLPLLRTAQIYYGNLSNIEGSSGVFFPTPINQLAPDGHVPAVYNYNAGLQRELGYQLFLDVYVSIREKARIQLRLEAFNHTEWGGVNSTILFDSAGTVKNLPSQLGGGGGRLGFGPLNAIRANSQRILQIAAKVVF